MHCEGDYILSVVVLYRDPLLIICEKPVGISSESPGLPELVSELTGQKVWPVHRLDQGTGGAIILACSPRVSGSLQLLFQQSLVQKDYLAVISGKLPAARGTWKDLLWHDRKKNKTYIVSRMRGGVKDAVCEWTMLASVPHEDQDLSLVRVSLHTGRTHQIRVQFGSRGFPLVGDRKYGSHIHAASVALWAFSLSFPHPDQKSGVVSVVSAPPSVFPWNCFPAAYL